MSRSARAVRTRRGPARLGAIGGIAAGAFALGVAEIAAAVVSPSSAPLIALADAVVDAAPPAVKDLAIRLFGTGDKFVLLAGAVVVAALLSALAGRLAVRGSRAGVWLVLGLGALAALAAATRPDAGGLSVMPSLLGAVAGMVALHRFAAISRPAPPLFAPGDEPLEPLEPPLEQPEVEPDPRARAAGRRAVVTAGLLAGGGLVAGAAGRLIGRGLADADASREALRGRLPVPADPAPPLPAGVAVDVPGVVPFRVPNDDFYRIDTALIVPRVPAETWTLRIHGMVGQEVRIGFDDLRAGSLIERDITLACVSNTVGGDLIGNARWLGLPLGPLLARARPRPEADMVLSTSADGWTCSTPLAVLTDGRDAMLAIGMNGEPLPVQHGFPVRMVVPGLYGYVSATKWVVDLEVTRFDRVQAYWTPRGWSPRGPIKTASRIDVPRPDATVRAGQVAVAGIAWAQHRGIRAVQVQVDDGEWLAATLAAEASIDTWRQWVLRWQATPGRHRLRVRAVDGADQLQTGRTADPAPDGATGWHAVDVEVR